jgi:hypothetical protein
MPNCSERAISTVIIDPDIAVGPCNDVARNIVGVDKEHGVVVDHLINATVPRGDTNNTVTIFAQASHRYGVAHRWPVLPTRSVPFEKAILSGPNPDVALEVREHCVHLIG